MGCLEDYLKKSSTSWYSMCFPTTAEAHQLAKPTTIMSDFLFTSESVSEGHPDKVADAISDAVLDALLAQDPRSRVGAETLVKDNLVVLAGEITTGAKVDYAQIARNTIRRIGYTDPSIGFDADEYGDTRPKPPSITADVTPVPLRVAA